MSDRSQEEILDSIMAIVRFETGVVSEHRCRIIRKLIRECIWPAEPKASPESPDVTPDENGLHF